MTKLITLICYLFFLKYYFSDVYFSTLLCMNYLFLQLFTMDNSVFLSHVFFEIHFGDCETFVYDNCLLCISLYYCTLLRLNIVL